MSTKQKGRILSTLTKWFGKTLTPKERWVIVGYVSRSKCYHYSACNRVICIQP